MAHRSFYITQNVSKRKFLKSGTSSEWQSGAFKTFKKCVFLGVFAGTKVLKRISTIRQKDPPLKRPPLNSGEIEILSKESKGEKWKLKRPPPSKPENLMEGEGSFWRKAMMSLKNTLDQIRWTTTYASYEHESKCV